MPVKFFFPQKTTLTDRNRLKIFLETIFRRNNKKLISAIYIFCSDQYLLDINKQFLKHDFYTDIISFNLSDDAKMVNAEVYISVDRVRDNAKKFKTSVREELHRVIFHGSLHLCGYNDKTRVQIQEMRNAEKKCLIQYFYKCST